MSSDVVDTVAEQGALGIFNGFRVVEAHLAEREAIENYVLGKTAEYVTREAVCHPACLFGQWLHGEEKKVSEHRSLFDALCAQCETFYEMASQAVLLKNLGEEDMAQAILARSSDYTNASTQFQHHLFWLHDKLHERYRTEE